MNLTTFMPDAMDSTTYAPESVNDFANVTVKNCPGSQGGHMFLTILKVVYVVGIVGNGVAIVCLRRGEKRVRNRKHLLLLTSLASNDLVALVGMMTSMIAASYAPWVRETRAYCIIRVVLRVFGIGSVCIAVTMALERYLALTRPFLYQKQVTYYVIRTALLGSWLWAAALTCAPVLGFGLYFDERTGCCTRYRLAVTTLDRIYAWFYVMFGTLLCVILVYCNMAVIRALYEISAPRGAPVVRRVSKSSCRQRAPGDPHRNPATAEEVAFSRLMAALSVLFMICWLPQMITSSLYLALGRAWWRRLGALGAASDLLMLLNYVLDPLLYVLMRRGRSGCARALANCFKRNHKTSTESIKTSCCPQETILVSDSSGAEMRPLRALPAPAHLLD